MSHEIGQSFFKYIAEIVGISAVSLLTFFGKRTLANYDKKLEQAEKNDLEIKEAITLIQMKVSQIEVILNERCGSCASFRRQKD